MTLDLSRYFGGGAMSAGLLRYSGGGAIGRDTGGALGVRTVEAIVKVSERFHTNFDVSRVSYMQKYIEEERKTVEDTL